MPYYNELTKKSVNEPAFPQLKRNQIVNLGWAHTKKDRPKTSYINYPKQKKANTLRIGIFGDSFVAGYEAAYGYDFPSLLQGLFNDFGATNIEVINFGVTSFGTHQAFLLWRYLEKIYALDYTIFSFRWWHRKNRDSSFSFAYNQFYPLHARYIIEKNTLKLVPVIGRNRLEAIQIYHHIFPPWQYVRYDYKAPMFLRLFLPSNRTIKKNPFYYRYRDFNREHYRLHKLILESLLNQAKKIIILCQDDVIYSLHNEFNSKKIFFYKMKSIPLISDKSSLYLAPLNHHSSLANELISKELFYLLTGARKNKFQVLNFFEKNDNKHQLFIPSPPLSEYEKVSVNIGKRPVARFFYRNAKDSIFTFSRAVNFQETNVSSLLWYQTEKGIKFIPCKFLLRDKEAVFISFNVDNKIMRIPIGFVNATSPIFGRLSLSNINNIDVYLKKTAFRYNDILNKFQIHYEFDFDTADIFIELGATSKNSNVFKRANVELSKKILVGSMNYKNREILFTPTVLSMLSLRVTSKESFLINDIKQGGTLDLCLQDKDGHIIRYPIVFYQKVNSQALLTCTAPKDFLMSSMYLQ